MPYNDPDETDPMTLNGVEIETDDPSTMREMALCFIEEYVRLGHSAETILELFTNGDFAGPTMALHHLGRGVIHSMIEEQFGLWGPRARRLAVDQTAAGMSLPVLQP
ncbi:MAG TPA: hypothetical protein VJZ71_00765 [Phycisphaerae bacterium]|nr:hypothetical protein [Phycisphaerae bacterium]